MREAWPTWIDWLALCAFLGGLAGILLAGHALLVLDVRRYLRSLRRSLVVVRNHLPRIPKWARMQTPRCLVSLGLRLPCGEAEILAAYRRKVKKLHPDRGGDQKRFLQLQKDFEEALAMVRRPPAPEVENPVG